MTNVIVTINGVQRDGFGDDSRIEFITVGRHYHKNGVDYITYDESEISGMDGTTTMLKIYGDHVVLVRMGQIEQRQEFRQSERSSCSYITPFGTMQMSVLTSAMEIHFAKSSGQVEIAYDLEIDGKWQSSNTLSIEIREEGQNNGH